MLFKVIVVMISISRLDSRQNEVNGVDDKTVAEISEVTKSTLAPPYCHNPSPNVTGFACKIGENTTVRFEFKKNSKISTKVLPFNQENDTCYEFNKTESSDSIFSAKTSGIVENCTYILLTSLRTHYIEGIKHVQSVCPDQEPLCITDTQKSEFLECPVQNFTVVPVVYHHPIKHINLNLTWEKIDYKAFIQITRTKESSKLCWIGSHIFSDSLLTNYIIKPDMITQEEVNPSCQYEINITSDTKDKRFRCIFNYTVPERVEDIYDCEKYGPFPNILSVKPTGDTFLVKWDPGEKARNGQNYVIKLVDFKYKQVGYYYAESAEELAFNGKEGTSQIVMKLLDGENYTLTGTFVNNFSCSKEIRFTFIAPSKSNNNVIIILAVGVVLLFIIMVFNHKNITRYITKILNLIMPSQRPSELARLQSISISMNRNIHYTPIEVLKGIADQYEFPRSKIKIKEVIGSGAFGQVYSAKAIGIDGVQGYKMVAVKTLGEGENISREATDDFIAEIEIFKKIGHHPNIVALLGCCTLEPPYMMIMEFVPCGDLKNYLLELREQWLKKKNIVVGRQIFFPDYSDGAYIETPEVPTTPKSATSSRLPSTTETVSTSLEDPMTPLLADYTHALDKVLDHTELQNFALQIAKGMAHLEKIAVTHRDLAARNILINEFKTLKISDFGLSRSGPYINHKTKKLPLRWMAIEAIVDQKYDNKSDVWSFGVVLWEIGTLGAFPYENIPDSFIQQFLQLGRRLERPEICTDELYSLMKDCWATDPEKRPTFQELVGALDVKKRKVYVNFNQLNPTYVFPPSDTLRVDNSVSIIDVKTEVN